MFQNLHYKYKVNTNEARRLNARSNILVHNFQTGRQLLFLMILMTRTRTFTNAEGMVCKNLLRPYPFR